MFKKVILLFMSLFYFVDSVYLRERKVFVFSFFDITSPQRSTSVPVKRMQCFDSKYNTQEVDCDFKEAICSYKLTTDNDKDVYKCNIDSSLISSFDIVCESSNDPNDLKSITTYDSCYLKVFLYKKSSYFTITMLSFIFFIIGYLVFNLRPKMSYV